MAYLQYLVLQYGPYTSYNTVQFQFSFFFLNAGFSTMKIVSAATNTLLLTVSPNSTLSTPRNMQGHIPYFLCNKFGRI